MRQTVAEKLVEKVVESFRIRREFLGWSQRGLAGKAGVDPKTVSLIERGIRSPTLFTLSLLAYAMDVPLWQLMKDAEERKENKA